jgi:DNA-binding response OmpR family regulator/two-component sensor histidine kinase
MDMSKIEAGYVKMIVHEGDLAKYISAIADIFNYQADEKQIDYNYKINHKSYNAWFDSDKIEKILYNLLSNAMKYTAVGGKVDFKVKFNDPESSTPHPGFVEFWVKDTGIGISEEDQKKIFDRFYQAGNNKNSKQSGSGIGLSLAQGLVNKYGGVIEIKSELGKGTEFYFRLPFTRNKFEAEYAQPDYNSVESTLENNDVAENENLPILLIVEDNVDLIHYISDHFKNQYKVLQALNGRDGINLAREHIPDIIISDIMMPDTDGIELCRTLKSDENTSHIPIILLTAKASDESQVEGLETGADDFLAKPFNILVLEVRLKNLLESRQKLKSIFSQKINIEPKEISITSVDAKFIQKAMDLVEKHMADAEFNVDQMSKEIGMSRASLHRKMIALTDLPPSGFIRAMRLKRSARLLVEGQHTVSEVLYEVGIKSRSYFTKSFKEMFGMSPTEYVMQSNSNKENQKFLIEDSGEEIE